MQKTCFIMSSLPAQIKFAISTAREKNVITEKNFIAKIIFGIKSQIK